MTTIAEAVKQRAVRVDLIVPSFHRWLFWDELSKTFEVRERKYGKYWTLINTSSEEEAVEMLLKGKKIAKPKT